MADISIQNDSNMKVNQDATIITAIPKADRPGRKGTYLIMGIVGGIALLTSWIISIVNVAKSHKKMKDQERNWTND